MSVIPCLLVIFGMVAKADKGKYLVFERDFNGSTAQCSPSNSSKARFLFPPSLHVALVEESTVSFLDSRSF